MIEKVNTKNNIISKKSKYWDGYQLDFSSLNLKNFKIVKKINEDSNKENYLKVSIANEVAHRIFVIINEFREGKVKIYSFEFDEKGILFDWCLSSQHTRIILI